MQFMFNVQQTAKVIWRGLVSFDRLKEPGVKLRTLGYMLSGLFLHHAAPTIAWVNIQTFQNPEHSKFQS